MYVEIFTKSDENEESRGKTTWMNTHTMIPSIELRETTASHLGSPPWYVEVKGTDWRELTSGDRGGEMRSNRYELQLHLTPTELAALTNFALLNRLVEVVPAQLAPKLS